MLYQPNMFTKFDEDFWNGSIFTVIKVADAAILNFVSTAIPKSETYPMSRSKHSKLQCCYYTLSFYLFGG